jgi:hypothetical protein
MRAPMSLALDRPIHRWAFGVIALFLTTSLLVLIVRENLPKNLGSDFICFWTAGVLLSSGESPYDAAGQMRIQAANGWDTNREGIGIYQYMPYLYPPWFGFLFMPLVPLGYGTAKAFWIVLNFELLFATGYLLRRSVFGVPPSVPMIAVPFFMLSLASILLGQVTPLVLFLLALVWQALDRCWDHLAGMLMAWLTFKPQLTAILLFGVLLWAIRRRRWGVVLGFVTGFLTLSALSALILPNWPALMLRAWQSTPLPTDSFPWYGTSWFLILKTLNFSGATLWILYAGVSLLFLGVIVARALRRDAPLDHLLAICLIAVFFVATYVRAYDMSILLIPLFVLMGKRLSPVVGAGLLLVVMVVPYGYFFLPARFLEVAVLFMFIPILMSIVWLVSTRRQSRPLADAN